MSSNFVDRNADSKLRLRRNAQRTRAGDLTGSIKVTAPITNTGSIGLNASAPLGVSAGFLTLNIFGGGLSVAGGFLSVVLANTTLTQGSGLSVNINSVGGLTAGSGSGIGVLFADATLNATSSGLFVQLADTSLVSGLSGIAVQLNATPGLIVSSGLKVLSANASIVVNGSGVSVGVASNGGLQSIGSGVAVLLADTSLTASVSGLGVRLAASGGLQINSGLLVRGVQVLGADPGSPSDGDTWLNTSFNNMRLRVKGVTNFVPTQLVSTAAGSAIANTVTLTALNSSVAVPANWFQPGRSVHMRAWGAYGASGAAPTLLIGGYADTTNALGDSFTTSLGTSTAGNFYLDLIFTCLTTGAANTIRSGGTLAITVNGVTTVNVFGTTLNVNTANAMTLEPIAQWSVAALANTITCYGSEIGVNR